MIEPAMAYRRTDAQIADPVLAWQRPDRNFFAAGACHILAFQAAKCWPSTRIIHVRPRNSERGHHVFVAEGSRAYDFNGWSDRGDLVRVNGNACRNEDPLWECDLVEVTTDLVTFCVGADSRPPSGFPGDVLARADRCLEASGEVGDGEKP